MLIRGKNNFAIKSHLIIAVFCFCTFILLLFFVISKNKLIEEIDQNAFSFLSIIDNVKFADSNIVTNTISFSLLYGEAYFWTFTMVVLFFFGGKKGRNIVFILFVLYLLLIPVGFLLKDIIKRERPMDTESNSELSDASSLTMRQRTQHSFPSGHAMIVSAGAFVIVFHLLYFKDNNINNNYNHKRNSIALSIASVFLIAEAVWICILQVIVNAHYITDVLAGISLGIGIPLLVILSLGKWITRLQNLLFNIPVLSSFEKHMEKMEKGIVNLKKDNKN